MRKILAAIFSMAVAASVLAGPASRRPFTYLQPDGSELTLVRHGDENRHWTTTAEGVRVELDAEGFYRPVSPVATAAPASSSVQRAPSAPKASLSLGEKRFLVILIDFPDLHFKVPDARSAFSAMMNARGYSENRGTGSVRDYFVENSNGSFRPVFDVYGPVTVDNPYAYYGENTKNGEDKRPDFLLYEACQKLDRTVDYSDYDNDGDGVLDNIFFYYAGYNEAEGGDENTIWPHSWSFSRFKAVLDGVRFNNYACTSELSGNKGVRMCGIGTFCHEFCHTLGLKDFYDTDYEDNGSYDVRDDFDLMSSGNYNNDTRTPPYLNSYERYLLGWQDFPSAPMSAGKISVRPVQEGGGLCIPTTEEGEFFLIETRNGKGWDSYAGSGYLVYHVDRTENLVDGVPAVERWDYNTVNCVGQHPCFALADAPLEPWYGQLRFGVSDLAFSDGVASLVVSAPSYLSGIVTDALGGALELALVRFADAEVRTDMDGRFMIPLSDSAGKLVVSCPGYGTRELTATESAEMKIVMQRESAFAYIRIQEGLVHGQSVTPEFVSPYVPVSIVWHVDSREVPATFVFPSAGEYEIRAEVVCPDGTVESVFQIVEVR